MTKFKRLAAAISALCVAVSAFTAAPIYAAEDDGVLLKADFENDAPEFVALDSTKPTHTVADGYATIKGSYNFGGYKFKKAMTSGKYEVNFDFNITKLDKSGGIHFTDAEHGKSNQPCEWQILNTNASAGMLAVGGCASYAGGAAEGATLTGLSYETGKWYSYHMIVNKTTAEFTVTVTERGNSSNMGTATGNGFPEKDIDHMMIGWTSEISIDNILIQEYHGAPTVSAVKLFDVEGNEQKEADPSTAAVKIIFSDEMDEDSLEDAVIVTGAGDASLSDDGTEYYVEIDDVLKAGEEFTVKVTTDAMSVNEMNLESEYKKTYTVANPNVLLNIDFDDRTATLEHFHDYTASSEILTEENGNKYMKISNTSAADSGDGFRLSGEIPTTGGDYTLSFDFMLPGSVGNAKYMCLNEHLKSGNGTVDNAYNQFGLLRTNNGMFYFNGSALDGEDNFAEADVWYSYTLNFNRTSGAYEIEIKTRDGEEIVGSATGTLTDADYSDGMRYNKVYNSIKFHYKPVICVDNLFLEKALSKPTLSASSLTFLDKDGNTLTTTGAVSMLADKISLNFGESINGRTVDGNIVLTDGKGAPVSFGYELSGTCIILKNVAFKPGTTYKLVVKGDITGASGEKLYADGASYTFEFKTEEVKESATLSKLSVNGVDITAFRALKNGAAVVAIAAENTSPDTINNALVITYYDKNGKRVGVSAYDVEIEGKFSGTKNVDVEIEIPETATSAKIMLWDSLASVVPVSEMLKF